MAPPEKGNPEQITLRMKNNTQTTLLLAWPSQTFESIASDLLSALREAYPTHRLPNGVSIPLSASDVLLGSPNDVNDLENGGFTLLWAATEDEEEEKSKKKRVEEVTLSSAMIKNGAVIAYKFREEVKGEDSMDVDAGWDVKVPKYEDDE